ncbi:uncharacterized protein [Periplaneta americana]|uniref:uncharacterized protein isoform X5 n=1 Tax=Periplaneta americana TaxID=6978 RepID=UPI0037E92244
MPSYVKCEYLKCNNRKAGHPNKCFFKIPEDSERCKAWLEAMGREDLMVILPKKLHNNFRVCADHFEDKYFTSTLRTHLNRKAIPCKVGTISTGQVMMDEIKMEPEVDPLGLQPDENTLEVKENTTLSEVGNLSHLQVADIKTECVDGWYDLTPEIKVEDIPEPVSFAIVKSEPESTPVPYIYPTIKSEVDEDSFHLERVQQEVKLEISSEDNEEMPIMLKRATHQNSTPMLVIKSN